MRLVLAFSAAALFCALGCSSLTSAPLFNGHDLAGWELVAPPPAELTASCRLLPEGVIDLTGQPSGFLATTESYENYRLHAEWRWTDKPGNGGVLVHISSGPKDRVWPLSLQIQTKHHSVGDLLPMAGATFAEPLTSAPGASPAIKAHTAPDSEKPAGEWNSCDILCQGDVVEVTVNGVVQNRITHASLQRGRVGFQFEGAPFQLRHVALTPLN